MIGLTYIIVNWKFGSLSYCETNKKGGIQFFFNPLNKTKNKQMVLHQTKKLLHSEESINRVKGHLLNGRRYLQAKMDRGLE